MHVTTCRLGHAACLSGMRKGLQAMPGSTGIEFHGNAPCDGSSTMLPPSLDSMVTPSTPRLNGNAPYHGAQSYCPLGSLVLSPASGPPVCSPNPGDWHPADSSAGTNVHPSTVEGVEQCTPVQHAAPFLPVVRSGLHTLYPTQPCSTVSPVTAPNPSLPPPLTAPFPPLLSRASAPSQNTAPLPRPLHGPLPPHPRAPSPFHQVC